MLLHQYEVDLSQMSYDDMLTELLEIIKELHLAYDRMN